VTWEDWQRPDGWIEAPYIESAPATADDQAIVLGIDCEMVSTKFCARARHLELTRIEHSA
jgi:hypothetical protein